MSNSTMIKVLIGTNLATLIIFLIVMVFMDTSTSKYEGSGTHQPIDFNINTSNNSNSFSNYEEHPNAQKILIRSDKYNIHPGTTFYVDKGSMKLYADIISIDNNKLFIYGKVFHNENELADGSINEIFTRIEADKYINDSNTIQVAYDGETAVINDNRVDITLNFNGKLKLIPALKVETPKNIIISKNDIEEVEATEEENEEEEVDVIDGIIVDEYNSNNVIYDGMIANNNLRDYLKSDYEQTDFVITAKYIESADNSGTLYEDIHSGIKFYAFGAGYPYEPVKCNTVTITATYRGNEQHFNGLEMDSTYPCFVIKSLRKPTSSEVKGGE